MREVSSSNPSMYVSNGASHRPTPVGSSNGDYIPSTTQTAMAMSDASRGPTPPRTIRTHPDYNPLCPLASEIESEDRRKTVTRLHDEVVEFLAEVAPTDLSKNQRQEIVDKVSFFCAYCVHITMCVCVCVSVWKMARSRGKE
jgi:hypothetical protein